MPPIGRKYLQFINLTKGLYPEYIKSLTILLINKKTNILSLKTKMGNTEVLWYILPNFIFQSWESNPAPESSIPSFISLCDICFFAVCLFLQAFLKNILITLNLLFLVALKKLMHKGPQAVLSFFFCSTRIILKWYVHGNSTLPWVLYVYWICNGPSSFSLPRSSVLRSFLVISLISYSQDYSLLPFSITYC